MLYDSILHIYFKVSNFSKEVLDMWRILSFLYLALFALIQCGEGARILSLFPMPSGSHVILGYELSVELARRGHEVVMVTPYPNNPKIENFTEIYLKDLAEEMFSTKILESL